LILPFSEHVYKLCLDYRLYTAAIKLQSDLGLGKAYAGMLPYVEGLYSMGYLDKETYELYRNKYSVTLEDEHNNKNKSPVQIMTEQTRAAECKAQNKYFGEALRQWSTMKPSSKQYYLKKATEEDNRKLKNARLLLELGAQESERSSLEG